MKIQEILRFIVENKAAIALGALGLSIYLYDELVLKPSLKPGAKKIKNKPDKTLKTGKFSDADGIIFGKPNKKEDKVLYSPAEAEGHILVTGGSGTGKTSCVLINCLNAWNKRNTKNTSFVIDISGDINTNVNMPNKLIYEPRDPKSAPYNIFGYIDRLETNEEKVLQLDKLALLILGESDAGATDAGSYYKNSAQNLLQGALIAFYGMGMDFIEICKKINTQTCNNLLNDIDATMNEDAIARINDFVGMDDIALANIKQTLGRMLSIFIRDPYLQKNIRRPNEGEEAFEPAAIETHNCFIMVPDEDLSYYRQLMQVLTAQTLNYFKGRPLDADHTILMALDEAASLGTIDIREPLQKYRKHKIRIMVLVQSIADIDINWGHDEKKSLLANFKYKVCLEASEPDEQEYWARAIGNDVQISKSRTGDSLTESERKDYIIEPSTLADLGDKMLLRYRGGYRILHKRPYYIKQRK